MISGLWKWARRRWHAWWTPRVSNSNDHRPKLQILYELRLIAPTIIFVDKQHWHLIYNCPCGKGDQQ